MYSDIKRKQLNNSDFALKSLELPSQSRNLLPLWQLKVEQGIPLDPDETSIFILPCFKSILIISFYLHLEYHNGSLP
jgi:hypothetical protein